MTRTFTTLCLTIALSGCAVIDLVPSFWDDNQSRAAIDIRLAVEHIDCSQPQQPQVAHLSHQIRWFQLYSESKGKLQKDVLQVMEPMSKTVAEWSQRVSSGKDASSAYCEIKKKVLTAQSRLAAQAVLGRY